MSSIEISRENALAAETLEAFDRLNGPQPGFRPAHAKGILIGGRFTPSASAKTLTCAPHIQNASTPVTVRFSDFAGIPAVPDNDPNASPRGIAIRFHLAEHVHTDIIAHTANGFPVRTVEEFVEFLRALYASGPDAAPPTPIDAFLAAHPAALKFVQMPKPMPTSFAKAEFYAINAYKFINDQGVARYGRYRIQPERKSEYLDAAAATNTPPNFLFDEIRQRLAAGPVTMRIAVQLAGSKDAVDDSTIQWPEDRPQVDFGTLELSGVLPDNEEEQRHVIFDPIPRVAGIDPSEDPLLGPRATIYLMSGRRRRASSPGRS